MSNFKIGDRVKSLTGAQVATWARGLTGTVSKVSSCGVVVTLDSPVLDSDEVTFDEHNLELLEPEPVGRKDDGGKTRWSLVPRGTLRTVIKVLEHGAKKYGDNNWEQVPHARIRYYDAANRHLDSWWGGEDLDPESGLPHLAHAACCILFLLAKS